MHRKGAARMRPLDRFGLVTSGVAALAFMTVGYLGVRSDPDLDGPTRTTLWFFGPVLAVVISVLAGLAVCAGIALFAPQSVQGRPSSLLIPAAGVVVMLVAAAFYGLSTCSALKDGGVGLLGGSAGWGTLLLRHRRTTTHRGSSG